MFIVAVIVIDNSIIVAIIAIVAIAVIAVVIVIRPKVSLAHHSESKRRGGDKHTQKQTDRQNHGHSNF